MKRTTRECARMFHIIGQPTRLKIIQALIKTDSCVEDLARFVGVGPARVSHHLAILRSERIVQATREGKHVRYRLSASFRCCILPGPGAVAMRFPCLGKFIHTSLEM
ncbi:MAG: winged helix-turn-helix transcriptional regulator [Candidatus Omnitrophica bacterium]|nr:winged helix-turn-helix transcriptional regulator [Candidatus Omnitrophota bacterium]